MSCPIQGLVEDGVPIYTVRAVPILSEMARRAAAGEPVNPFDPVILPSGGIRRDARCWPYFEANSKEHVQRLFEGAKRDPDTHELVEYRIHSIEKVAD